MKKPLFSVLFTVLLLGLSTMRAQATFSDISSPTLRVQVEYLSEKGIIKGYADGTFKPGNVINRAEALKIIFESRGIPVQNDTNSGFPDVPSGEWYAKYVTTAKKLGLISGYPDGTYKPAQPVNTVEFIKIAMKAQSYYQDGTDASAALSQYSDIGANEWYMPYVAFGMKYNFLLKSQKLSPSKGLTRGDAAYIIYQVAKYNEANGGGSTTPEPAPAAECTGSMCVNGVDLSQYEWSTNSIVKVEGGKLLIANENNTDSVRQEGSTGRLTINSESILSDEVKRMQYIVETRETTGEEKRNIDVSYPEYYARILGINGGKQSGDSYLEGGRNYEYLYRNKDGKLIKDCDCNFELQVINTYNGKDYPPFEEWRTSDAGKERLYDVIRQDLFRIQQE